MARSIEFLRCRDIDWAVKLGNNYIHVASAGGDLPTIVENKLHEIWRELKKTDVITEEVIINEDYIAEKFPNNMDIPTEERDFRIQWYLCSFIEMAKCGFYSFDRDVRTPFEKSKYRLVVSPGRLLRERPNYDLPAIGIEMNPAELDGKDIVRLINEFARLNKR